MTKFEIYNIFVKGIEYGVKYGPFPGLFNDDPSPELSLLDYHNTLTKKYIKNTVSTLWIVIIAGFNYGSNERIIPTEKKMQAMFENLIAGKPLEDGDKLSYDIKERIDKLISN